MESNDATVRHDRSNDRFVMEEGGEEAELVYRTEGDRLVLLHTGVPEAFRGRGIGGDLVRAAADFASSGQITVAPWCTYARKWLEEHTDVTDRINVDWSPPPGQ